jgi:hypothetical protein
LVDLLFGEIDKTKTDMKCIILYSDDCNPVSEVVGFDMPCKVKVVEGSTVTLEFDSLARIPFAASANQMRTAVVNQMIQAAMGQGKVVQAADCTVIGSVS